MKLFSNAYLKSERDGILDCKLDLLLKAFNLLTLSTLIESLMDCANWQCSNFSTNNFVLVVFINSNNILTISFNITKKISHISLIAEKFKMSKNVTDRKKYEIIEQHCYKKRNPIFYESMSKLRCYLVVPFQKFS